MPPLPYILNYGMNFLHSKGSGFMSGAEKLQRGYDESEKDKDKTPKTMIQIGSYQKELGKVTEMLLDQFQPFIQNVPGMRYCPSIVPTLINLALAELSMKTIETPRIIPEVKFIPRSTLAAEVMNRIKSECTPPPERNEYPWEK